MSIPAGIAARLFNGVVCRSAPDGIYMTFDDGPHPDATPRLLDLLNRHNIRASFFLTTEAADRHPDLVSRIAAAGHRVGSHGETHRSLLCMGYRSALESLDAARQRLGDISGAPVNLLRPPYGRFNPAVLRAARKLGLTLVLWSVNPRDYRPGGPETIAERIRRRAGLGDIVLLHDGGRFALRNIQAVELFLKATGGKSRFLQLEAANGA